MRTVGRYHTIRWKCSKGSSRGLSETDRALRRHLPQDTIKNDRKQVLFHTQNPIGLTAFKETLGRAILKQNDKMLYAAKYLWYADMLSRRELGRSLTGATYANLTYGPQLNNYRDLLDEIRNADISEAEALTEPEMDIIERIAKTFPENKMVYDAAHKEPAWLETRTGELIPYSWAGRLVADIR